MNESNLMLFNLTNVIPLKLNQKDRGFELYFLNKSPDDYDFMLRSIHFEDLDHFLDLKTLNKLKENYILLQNCLILKNIQMKKLDHKSKRKICSLFFK